MGLFIKPTTKYIFLVSCIIASAAAFINKYPFVYSDTGTYIYSGFNGLVFDDRSIFYGLFLRHTSLASSLWYVVFSQSLMVCYVLYMTLTMFVSETRRDAVFIFLIAFLTLTTGFSFTVGILIPDIFSSISILCLINLLLNKQLNRFNTVLISCLFVFSVSTQFSSIVIMLMLFFFVGINFAYRKLKSLPILLNFKRFFYSMGLLISCLLIVPAVHYCFGKEFKISGSTHVFVMNHLLETGILEDYLEKNCDKRDYKICDYKENLGWDFIWAPESPIQKTGGWKANREEYNKIILDIVTTPKYVVLLSQKALEYSFKQFFSFNIEVPSPHLEGSPPFGQIRWRFKDSLREYISSLQSAGKWDTHFLNFLQNILIMLSLVFLLLVMLTPSLFKRLSPELRWLLVLVLLHNVLNSFVCSNLSTVDARFQNRIIWLLPLCVFLITFKYFERSSYFSNLFKKP